MTNEQEFTYEAFDRQLINLMQMVEVLADGWEDISTMEMNIDIRSCRIKAARICFMAETDAMLQHQDLSHSRSHINNELRTRVEKLIYCTLNPLMIEVVRRIKRGDGMEGHKAPTFPTDLGVLFPRLKDLLYEHEPSAESWQEKVSLFQDSEILIKKKIPFTQFPGMRKEERFWNLAQLYLLVCLLLLHFDRMVALCGTVMTEEEAGRLLLTSVSAYEESETGKKELERYQTALVFDNDGFTLNSTQLKEAQKKLRFEVPTSLQLCYMKHIDNMSNMGLELTHISHSDEDFQLLVAVLAKWQLLAKLIHEQEHPNLLPSPLYNEVFRTTLQGRPIDLLKVRQRIERMLPLIKRKNQWFCVWKVLEHHQLIKQESFEAFARQMMHKDWFASLPADKHFSGDTLREYNGYLTTLDYTAWDSTAFLKFKLMHNRKKWSNELSDKFQRLCYDLDEVFEE